jgi:phospholipid transport system substrate-binding protein
MKKVVLILFLILGLSVNIFALEPREIIRTYSDKVINLFKEIDTKKPRQTWEPELKKKLLDLAYEVVDFNVMARMSLGPNWRKFNSEEQKKFVDLFVKMLENTYFSTIVDHMEDIRNYDTNNITIVKENHLSNKKVEVQTTILNEGKKIPVNYRMVKLGNNWKCYDVYIEGISLVQNYREQFNELMNKMSSKELLTYLEDKVRKGGGLKAVEVKDEKQN